MRTLIAGFVISGGIAGVWVAPTVAAEPPPPPPGPVVPVLGTPLGPQGISVLEQNGLPAVDALGTPALPDLTLDHALGQNPVPSAPGGPPGVAPDLNPFNSGYWLQQNQVPSAPGEGSLVGVGDENADPGRIDWIRQLYQLQQSGSFADSFLGQMPPDQLGKPLPGTAPAPGTNIPPGLVPVTPPT